MVFWSIAFHGAHAACACVDWLQQPAAFKPLDIAPNFNYGARQAATRAVDLYRRSGTTAWRVVSGWQNIGHRGRSEERVAESVPTDT